MGDIGYSSLLLLEREQILDLDFQNFGELLQTGDGRGINAALHQADELD